MNQILFNKQNDLENKYKKKKRKKYKYLFLLSLIAILLFFSYYIYTNFISRPKENVPINILNSYNINRLYSSNDSYTTILLNDNLSSAVIGNIEIPKININYPILSNTTDELLKIAPCRFCGPYPNQSGNLCIAGHNYDDDRFFGKLYELNIGDQIKINDSSNNIISYYIYDKYEINETDTTCTSQETFGKREITLVTCNNLNGNRLIIKAKE